MHEVISVDIQNEMENWCQAVNDENIDPIPPPTHTPPPQNANVLTDAGLTKLVALLTEKCSYTNNLPIPKTYTRIAQGVDTKVVSITYCHSHVWTRNLDPNSKNCSRPLEGHKRKPL